MSKAALQIAGPEQFAAVRNFLAAHYSEEAVSERLGLEGLHQYLRRNSEPSSTAAVQDVLDVLIKLFLTGDFVESTVVRDFIPHAILRSLESMGIVSPEQAGATARYSTVALYPVRGLFIASDRWTNPDGSPFQLVDDNVFPAIHELTHDFLDVLPVDPCERFLDLCSGTGVAALLAAKSYARHSWAVDVTERATRFAEFNRLLNDVPNATVMRGNLYDGLKGRTFDRIVAHPPYVPVMRPVAVYADGGEDGQFITRGIVEELPQYLEAGGRCYCVTMGVERELDSFEQRVRRWLGTESGCDVLFVSDSIVRPAQFGLQQARKTKGSLAEMDEWTAHFARLGIRNLAHGTVMIQKRREAGVDFTVRCQAGSRTGSAEIEWLRRWETLWASAEGLPFLLQSRPRVVDGFELVLTHAFRNGEWTVSKSTLRTDYPFRDERDYPHWISTLLKSCDGTQTVRELFETGHDWIRAGMPREEFGETLAGLVVRGILAIDGFELPDPAV